VKAASLIALCCLFPSPTALALNGEILRQNLDGDGNGYTILRVWGTPAEMGYAQGYLLSPHIESYVQQFKDYFGLAYAAREASISSTLFPPADVEEEIDGIIAGLRAVSPSSPVDAGDIKILNTLSDWGYTLACRSHSCWGSFVSSPVRTLSTRRLDFIDLPLDAIHHVLLVRIPSDRTRPRWANLAFPGYVAVITGVNEFGTLCSLHDYGTWGTPPSGANTITRSAAARFALTRGLSADPSLHLDETFADLQPYLPYVNSFVNYYVPDGRGGVFTCLTGTGFCKKRTPQTDYFGGQVIITTNSETDGHGTPSGGEEIAAYYDAGGAKSLDDHWESIRSHGILDGFHQLSLAFRGENDLTIRFEGRLKSGAYTETAEEEWSDLFRGFSTGAFSARTDYNGDGSSDIAVFRPGLGLWAVKGITRFFFGTYGDDPAPADFDGDGTGEAAVYRGTAGLWAARGITRFSFGKAGDLPLPADYDGDGTEEAMIFRPGISYWAAPGITRAYFGQTGDDPVPDDYDGDGAAELAVFRNSWGLWSVSGVTSFSLGTAADRPLPGDWDGDHTADAAIFRPSTGLWSVRSGERFYFGGTGYSPVVADLNGDGVDEAALFRDAGGSWSVRAFTRCYFGSEGDRPVTR
jgi:hypothetical protein